MMLAGFLQSQSDLEKSKGKRNYTYFGSVEMLLIALTGFGLFLNFSTLPGLLPAAVATPVGIETIPKNS